MEHLDEAAKVPFIDVGEKKLESSRSKRRTTMFAQIRRISQWRRTVYLGAVAATFTLLVNIVVLVWIASTCSSSSQNGVATIFTGSSYQL